MTGDLKVVSVTNEVFLSLAQQYSSTDEARKRSYAVAAALEIVRAKCTVNVTYSVSDYFKDLGLYADDIQKALEVSSEKGE